MAKKRMFNMNIVDSDAFLDMPLSAQCLYFHLNMRADDDGFVGNPKRVCRLVSASNDDLKLLIAKRFILVANEEGVIVIKHWRMHNTIQGDRYTPTAYQEEFHRLVLKDNKSYTEIDGNNLETFCKQIGNTDLDIDLGIGLDIDKNINKCADKPAPRKRFSKPSIDEVKQFIKENSLNVDADDWYNYYESNGWKVGRNSMKDWKACVRRWSRTSRPSYGTQAEMETEYVDISQLMQGLKDAKTS